MIWVLGIVLLVLVYAWVLYPMMLLGVRPESDELLTAGVPETKVAVILAAHNEEDVIEARIRNLSALIWPWDQLRVLVGNDGSSDQTGAILDRLAEEYPFLEVHHNVENLGKTGTLKNLVAKVSEPVLVLTDANTSFEPDVIQKLVSALDDDMAGAVVGRLQFVNPDQSETQEGAYWRLETWMKTRESALDSCLGANGAIYAMKRELFWQDIPDNTIVDDFVLAMKVREYGLRVRYLPDAVAWEPYPETHDDEWKRRVRIGAGDYQALSLCRKCLSPGYGLFAWMFFSHKVLRWWTPHLIVVGLMLAGMIVLSRESWAVVPIRVALAIGACGWIIGALSRKTKAGVLAPFRLFDYFMYMQAALFFGYLKYLGGDLKGAWDRTTRR